VEPRRPLVSIIIPTYNRAALLAEAIGSVLAQPVPDLEVIVVDDASTDDTAAIVAPFVTAGRVSYEARPRQGPAGARNAGVQVARGELIGFLDSDDRLLPDGLRPHLNAFERQPDLGLTISGCEYVDAAGNHLGWRTPWTEGGALTLSGWLFNCFAMPGTVVARRAWFERAGGFCPDLTIAEDWHLFMRLAALRCPMTWVREITCQYRQHEGNASLRLDRHLADSRLALDRILAQPGLDPEAARQGPAARAWVHAVFARRAIAACQPDQARSWLREALRLDPDLGTSNRLALTEALLNPAADWNGTAAAYGLSAAAHLPPELRPTRAELRRVVARLEMRRFFEAVSRGDRAAARQHLGRGLRRDPTWITNRGVLAFLARGLLARSERV
jgi:glycosyltransferase involved in cell wall biosynthesis